MAISFRDVIADPPANLAEWESVIKNDHGLDTRYPNVLRRMYRAHQKKIAPIAEQIQDMVDYPDIYIKPYVESGMSRKAAAIAVQYDLKAMRTKHRRLGTIVKCCRVELEIRELLAKAGRLSAEPSDGRGIEKALPVEAKTITAISVRTRRRPRN